MPAPATARCWRRARRSTSWRCATAKTSPAPRRRRRYGEAIDAQRRRRDLPPGRPCARLGADRGRAWRTCASSPRATTSASADPTCPPFEPVPCDVFITEATFGLPVFRHPADRRRDRPAAAARPRSFPSARISSAPMRSARRSASSGCCATPATTEPIYIHGALARLSDYYQSQGIDLGQLVPGDRRDRRARPTSPARS